MPSQGIVYGVTLILLYHVYQILIFSHQHISCESATGGGEGGSRLLKHDDPSVQSLTGSQGQRQSMRKPVLQTSQELHEFISHNSTLHDEDSSVYKCNRWNVTYVLPKEPTFIIVGTQKGGTSALATVLDHHPWMESSSYFEPHYFDFDQVMLHYRLRLDDEDSMCKVLRDYLQKNFNVNRLRRYPNLVAFEKTPAYILTPNAPARIKAVVPWVKIVVALRNPVDRLISQHKMTVERGWENRSFAETVAEDLNVMRHEGFWLPHGDPFGSSHLGAPYGRLLRKYKTEGMLYRGLYARQLLPWLEYYKLGTELLVVRYEEMRDDPVKVLNHLLDFVGAAPYVFPDDILNQSYSPRSSSWLTNYRPNITAEARKYLYDFYKPYNDELVALLGEEWRDVWVPR
jgi:Sulfotransferase domain